MSGERVFKHDVFISYSHLDEDWVFDVLVPHLESNHLTVLTDKKFVPGRSAVVNMEEAVDESKFTIIVLSENWIASQYSQFEAFLSSDEDAAAKQGRLIPVMIDKCTPPRYIGVRTRIEFLKEDECDAQMNRLIITIQGNGDTGQSVNYPSNTLRKGADILRRKTSRPAFSEAWCRLFNNACDNIVRLADFKDIHDQLHQLQVQCYDVIVREANRVATDDDAVENLTIYAASLQNVISEIRNISKRPSFSDLKCDWIEDLAATPERLLAAIAARDSIAVTQTAKAIDRVLAVQPALFNTRLIEAAKAIRLDDVLETINMVMASLGDGAEVLQGTKATIEKLRGDLKALVDDHDRWQETDTDLRRVEKYPDELIDTWPHLKSQIRDLAGSAEWAQPIQKEEQSVDSAIAAQNQKEMCSHLRVLRHHAIIRFYKVDTELKERCDKLRVASEPLGNLVRARA